MISALTVRDGSEKVFGLNIAFHSHNRVVVWLYFGSPDSDFINAAITRPLHSVPNNCSLLGEILNKS